LRTGFFDGFEMGYRPGTADERVLAASFGNDTLLASAPEYEPRANDVVVDIGAHIGSFALLMGSRLTDGTVYAVEASRETYDLLRFNIALNGQSNVQPRHLALSDVSGTVHLHHDKANWGHSVVAELSKRKELVPSLTLGDFFAAEGIEWVDFMKFNCEGSEFPIVLESDAGTLGRVGVMLILYHGDLYPDRSLEDLIDHLRSCGFRTVLREQRTYRGHLVAINESFDR
jgi:FkbM family methyltransferase